MILCGSLKQVGHDRLSLEENLFVHSRSRSISDEDFCHYHRDLDVHLLGDVDRHPFGASTKIVSWLSITCIDDVNETIDVSRRFRNMSSCSFLWSPWNKSSDGWNIVLSFVVGVECHVLIEHLRQGNVSTSSKDWLFWSDLIDWEEEERSADN